MSKGERLKVRGERMKVKGISVLCILYSVFFASCNPDAPWTTQDVTVRMHAKAVSAGYAEVSFSTDKDAYYFIDCVPVREGENPLDHPKQFMMLALDSAYTAYIEWRNWLLKSGEFNIAPFSSHMLQYGAVNHFFTNLKPETDYWVYAFVVDPQKQVPVGKLYLETITTPDHSIMDVHFDYRVRGQWDYIYPLNPDGKINNSYPYLAATRDSVYLADEAQQSPEEYFSDLFDFLAEMNYVKDIRYGVQVVLNDGVDSDVLFELGHTYYTAIAGFDGVVGGGVIYKFTWLGEDYEAYFTNEDNIVTYGEDE